MSGYVPANKNVRLPCEAALLQYRSCFDSYSFTNLCTILSLPVQSLITEYDITSYPTSIVIDKTGGIAFMLSAYDNTNTMQLDGVISALK